MKDSEVGVREICEPFNYRSHGTLTKSALFESTRSRLRNSSGMIRSALNPRRETLNKSVRDFSETFAGKRSFPVTYQINRLERSVLAVKPCAAETLTSSERS